MYVFKEKRMEERDLMLGIIGGSGIYEIEGVENGEWSKVYNFK